MSHSRSATSWQPESYAEMGAAVPFTSPELTGARARINASGLELTLPNPAGSGVYIIDPRAVQAFCEPTLHDNSLVAGLSDLTGTVTPARMRRIASEVAQAGFAGRAAASAARRRQQEDRKAWKIAQAEILRLLVPHAQNASSDAATLDRAAQDALFDLSSRSGHSPLTLIEAIDAAAQLAAATGVAGSATALYPALLADLDSLGRSVSQRAPLQSRADLGRAGRAASLVLSAAKDAIILTRRALAEARRGLEDIRARLHDVARLRAELQQHADRLDWLADGWAPICLVWRTAAPGRICAALNEIGLMVPAIPAEAGPWFGVDVQEASRQNLRAAVAGSADWRGGSLLYDLRVRNEAMRVLAF